MTLQPDVTPESRHGMLDLILLATMDALVEHDLLSHEIQYSDRWFLMLGFDPEHRPPATAELWLELIHPDDLNEVRSEWQAHIEDGWPFQMSWRMRHGHGGYRWIECRSTVESDDEGAAIRAVSLFADVTDQVATGHRHLALIGAMPDTLLRLDMDGRVLDLRLGNSTQAASLLSKVKVNHLLVEGGVQEEWVIELMNAATEALFHTTPQTLETTLSNEEFSICLETRVAPAGTSEVVCVIRDITDRKNLESRLQQAEKLEGIGQLAAGVAHEINTPLQFIGDNSRFLKTALERLDKLIGSYKELIEETASDDQKKKLSKVEKRAKLAFLQKNAPAAVASCIEGVERVGSIVAAMKEFSHPGGNEPTEMDVANALQSSIKISTNEWKTCCTVGFETEDNLPIVRAFVGEIQQTFLNIIVNGAHALRDKYGESGEGHIQCSVKPRGEGIEATIVDNGPGMPEEIRKRVFEPFFTTKEVGKGTGQGLALAYKTVVDRHGGEIFCTTEQGEGTTFTIRLRAAPPNLEKEGLSTLSSQAPGKVQLPMEPNEGTVPTALRALVVDDEVVNRRVISAMLSKLGLEVSSATDGVHAVEAWTAEHFDVIFMDLQMPRLCGLEATAQIRHLEANTERPPAAIVVVSGEEPSAANAELDLSGFLVKPCRLEDLKKSLEDVRRYRELHPARSA